MEYDIFGNQIKKKKGKDKGLFGNFDLGLPSQKQSKQKPLFDIGLGSAPKKDKKDKGILGDLGFKLSKPKKSPGLDFGLGQPQEKSRDTKRSFGKTERKEVLYQQDSECARCHKK